MGYEEPRRHKLISSSYQIANESLVFSIFNNPLLFNYYLTIFRSDRYHLAKYHHPVKQNRPQQAKIASNFSPFQRANRIYQLATFLALSKPPLIISGLTFPSNTVHLTILSISCGLTLASQ